MNIAKYYSNTRNITLLPDTCGFSSFIKVHTTFKILNPTMFTLVAQSVTNANAKSNDFS